MWGFTMLALLACASGARLLPVASAGVAAIASGLIDRGTKATRAAVSANPLSSVATSFAAGCLLGCIVSPAASEVFAIYDTAEDVPARAFRAHTILRARVVKVADGDTLRVAHTPLFSTFRRPASRRSKAEGGLAKLSESTLQVRIAAVDCPETAKFGSAGQQFGDEATEFVRQALEGRIVRVKLLQRDQYQRAVSAVSYGRGLWRRDISEELLKRGLATVYRQGGAQYDGSVERWDRLEADAQRNKRGLWSTEGGVDPAAYKRELKAKKER